VPPSPTPPASEGTLSHLLRGLRTLGLGVSLQAALYPLHRAYYEGKFSGPEPQGSVLRGLANLPTAFRPLSTDDWLDPDACDHLGDVRSNTKVGSTVILQCDNGALQLAVLSPGIWRVRLSRSGDFAPVSSYSVAKPEDEWGATALDCTDGPDSLVVRSESLTCLVTKQPCRLGFCDSEGNTLFSDRSGLAWRDARWVHGRSLDEGEHIYGLGEKAFPLDRRGRRYVMWNQDPQHYAPGADPIYLGIPFYMSLVGGRCCGVFYDNTYRSWLDLGQHRSDELVYQSEGGELCYYLLYGPSPAKVIERFTELTGPMPMWPLWALGYQQSRWSYYPEARVREIAGLFRQHRIPCDALHLDIHYMDGYRCFTWDRDRFPDPAALIADLHEQGFRVVTLIDCGIKADPAYHVCAAGLAGGMFCTYPDGQPAAGPVWPGESYFPDFTSERVREWWGNLHQPWVDMGVDGVWNDMNEPSIIGPSGNTLAGCVRHDWEGKGADHRQAHNVYGLQMVRATYEGLQRLQPDRRPFVLTRSGWAGVQRHATSWTADNASTWEHLRLTLPMVLGLGLSGLAFTGPDVGGFSGDADPELLVRWTQLGAFLPLFRNHTAHGTRDQEPWAHGEPYLSANRSAIEWRYRLLPYLYTAMWQCAQRGHPMARPLLWAFPQDQRCYELEDQFLCGDALLVAPVGYPGATSRRVYLPGGEWFDFWADTLHHGPQELDVPAPLDRLPLFVRAGTTLPMWPLTQSTAEPANELILHLYPGHGDSWLYEDDGHSMAYRRGEYRLTRFECRTTELGELSLALHRRGAYQPAHQRWTWHVHGLSQPPGQLLVDGRPAMGSTFDAQRGILRLETGEINELLLSP